MKAFTIVTPANVVPFRYAMSNNTYTNESEGVFVVTPFWAAFIESTDEGVIEHNMAPDAHTELVRCIQEERDPDAYHLFSGASTWHEGKNAQQVIGEMAVA